MTFCAVCLYTTQQQDYYTCWLILRVFLNSFLILTRFVCARSKQKRYYICIILHHQRRHNKDMICGLILWFYTWGILWHFLIVDNTEDFVEDVQVRCVNHTWKRIVWLRKYHIVIISFVLVYCYNVITKQAALCTFRNLASCLYWGGEAGPV